MIDFINTYGAELAQGTALLAIAAPFIRQRLISDKNLLGIFDKAKASIADSNNIKTNVLESIGRINKTVEKQREIYVEQTAEFERVILEFQESEIYTKMLNGLEQIDVLTQTLQSKDTTIEMLGNELKATKHMFEQILNRLPGGNLE